MPGADGNLRVTTAEFVPGGGGRQEFRPGQDFIPGGGLGLNPASASLVNAGEFVPGRPSGQGPPEFRPGQEFIPGLAANSANAGEFVPGSSGGREFVPGQQFIPAVGMDGGYDDEGSMMHPILDDDDDDGAGGYGGGGGYPDSGVDVNGQYVGEGYGEEDSYPEGEDEGWGELAAMVIGNGSPHPDNAVVYAAFDPAEELIWTGSASGRLASHWVHVEEPSDENEHEADFTSLRTVTQVRVFKDSPVRQIMSVNDGVLALGDRAVRIYTRGGVALATLPALDDAQGLLCMDLVPQTSALVCGGTNPVITTMDLMTSTVTRGFECGGLGISCLQATGRYVAGGSLDGKITLHDPRSLGIVHTLSAHAGPVTALDIREHLLVTCGMNIFRGQARTENAIKVFDLRRQVN